MSVRDSMCGIRRLLGYSLVVVATLCPGLVPRASAQRAEAADISVSQIIDGLRKRDQALTSLACQATLHFHRQSMHSGRFFDYTVATQARLDRLLHRSVVRSAGDEINPPAPFKQNQEYLSYCEEVIGCDGETTRTYRKLAALDSRTGEPTDRFIESASVEKGTTRGFPFDLDGAIGVYGRRSIAETLAEGPTTLLGEKEGVLSLECTYPEDADSKAQYQLVFEIDTRKAMAPVRVQELVNQRSEGKWVVTRDLALGDFSEKAPGIWLPGSFLDSRRKVLVQPHEDHELVDQVRSDSLAFTLVNTKFNDADFKVRIPRGVVVTDSIRGARYKSADITDAEIGRSAHAAKELQATYEAGKTERVPVVDEPGRGSIRIAVGTLLAVTLAAAVAGLAYWRHGRRGSARTPLPHPHT